MNRGFLRANAPLRPVVLLLSLLVAGCAANHPASSSREAGLGLEQRLDDLERRIQRLEGRPQVEQAYRDATEIRAHMNQLQAERARLLLKYTDQHPAVRDIDRSLGILQQQLDMQSE